MTTVDTPRPTRPGIGNGLRWSDLAATLDRIDDAIGDLDTNHPDTAQVAHDLGTVATELRTTLEAGPSPILGIRTDLTTEEMAELTGHIQNQLGNAIPVTPPNLAFLAERDRNAEQIQRIFSETPIARASWARRLIRRIFS